MKQENLAGSQEQLATTILLIPSTCIKVWYFILGMLKKKSLTGFPRLLVTRKIWETFWGAGCHIIDHVKGAVLHVTSILVVNLFAFP